MNFVDVIARKRDGGVNTEADFELIASVAASGDERLDYQLSAWLMAAFLNGLNDTETAQLTLAMARSGARLDLSGLPGPVVDKHSTGGVGDKTTIVLLPMLAASGLSVVKMSGAGLGITGGTVDKLGCVPGFRLDLSPEEMVAQAARMGVALTGQTPSLAPADKKLYALRDTTGTVANLSLITASILSKKIAGGAQTVVLDVKCGSGAFMQDLAQAEALRASLERVGAEAGLTVRALITDMDQPLGSAVGNALEVKEAIRILRGETRGPGEERFLGLCVRLAEVACAEAGVEFRPEGAEAKAREWFETQGADGRVFESEDWCVAPVIREIRAESAGWVERVDARGVGQVALDLGAGRKSKTDVIDPTVGVEVFAPVGSRVDVGAVLGRIHAASDADADRLAGELAAQWTVVSAEVAARPIVLN